MFWRVWTDIKNITSMTCHRLIALKEAGAGVATQKKHPRKESVSAGVSN